MIARERAAGAIRAVHSRRQPDDEQARLAVAEWRDRLAVVARVPFSHQIEKGGEARAAPASGVK